jgi:hypothetical protein
MTSVQFELLPAAFFLKRGNFGSNSVGKPSRQRRRLQWRNDGSLAIHVGGDSAAAAYVHFIVGKLKPLKRQELLDFGPIITLRRGDWHRFFLPRKGETRAGNRKITEIQFNNKTSPPSQFSALASWST